MPRITVTVDLGNAAFTDNPDELDRIFATAVFAVARARRANRADTVALFDLNGNRVGEASYNPE